ncbi:MAG: hypothetical protein U0667_10430 [Chloroflexota bacterium]
MVTHGAYPALEPDAGATPTSLRSRAILRELLRGAWASAAWS